MDNGIPAHLEHAYDQTRAALRDSNADALESTLRQLADRDPDVADNLIDGLIAKGVQRAAQR